MSPACHYPTDVSDEQWDILRLLLPKPTWHPGGPGRKPVELRRVLNGIFSVNKTGCQWRMMPTDLGNGHTLYGDFRRWRREGVWERLMAMLHHWERQGQGRLPEPSAGCVDSQISRRPRKAQTSALMGIRKSKAANGIC